MKLFKAFAACFSTYSRIPMPVIDLDSDDMKYAMIFFPFIGAFIGILEYLLYFICINKDLPKLFFSLISLAIPIMVTGGIHLDGFMDTMDAFSSYGDREKKLNIMKDPNTGAFAVIKVSLYFIVFVAFAMLVNEKGLLLFSMSFIISRVMSGVSVSTIKSAKSNGMLHSLKEKNSEKVVLFVLTIMGIISAGVLIINNILSGCVAVISMILFYFFYRNKCLKELDGITGDTSGFYLCMSELILVIIAGVVSLI